MGLVEVAKLLEERGFPKIDDGSDLVQLQQAGNRIRAVNDGAPPHDGLDAVLSGAPALAAWELRPGLLR